MSNPDIIRRLASVEARIHRAAEQYGRAPQSVRLLAVSKTQPPAAVAELADAGQTNFGENYLQEALAKREALATRSLVWHFIGPIQANKTPRIAASFDWVHSVDRYRVAQRLSDQRPEDMAPLNVCLQVNISLEDSKSGVHLAELSELAWAVAELPRLRLRGLMTIPAPAEGLQAQREPYARLREAQQELVRAGLALDTLSMGMSDDLEAAIAEGSTWVRVGTALFGPRTRTVAHSAPGH